MNSNSSTVTDMVIKAFALALILVGFTPLGTQLVMPSVQEIVSMSNGWAFIVAWIIVWIALAVMGYIVLHAASQVAEPAPAAAPAAPTPAAQPAQ
jgi:hypothetical protein